MDRKRPVLLLVLAALALIGYAAGALASPGPDGDATWRERLTGRTTADPLQPVDLRRTSGTCTWEGSVLRVPGSCALTVDPLDQRVTLHPVRAATLHAGHPVHVVLVVEGKRIEMDLEAGEDLRVTAGPAGTQLALGCLAAPTPCQLTLVGP